MSLSRSRLKPGAINPCLPQLAKEPPPGSGWLHEIKHDGFRLMARRNRQAVRLYTRNGYDFGHRFPKIIEAIKTLPVRSCFIDGEVIVVDERGLSVFDLIRSGRRDRDAVLCAFDLIELDGRTCAVSRSNNASRWRLICSSESVTASASMTTTMAMVRSSSSKLARLAARALCLSGSARRIAPAVSMIG